MFWLCAAATDTRPLREGDLRCTCREFDRSADFSDLFSKTSTCLGTDLPDADVNRLKRFLRYFRHPPNPDPEHRSPNKGRYVEREIYQAAASTEDILDALFINDYISATNFHLLRCIVRRFGCQKCKDTLQKYTEDYPLCTCNV